jgi:hypothetical protein
LGQAEDFCRAGLQALIGDLGVVPAGGQGKRLAGRVLEIEVEEFPARLAQQEEGQMDVRRSPLVVGRGRHFVRHTEVDTYAQPEGHVVDEGDVELAPPHPGRGLAEKLRHQGATDDWIHIRDRIRHSGGTLQVSVAYRYRLSPTSRRVCASR